MATEGIKFEPPAQSRDEDILYTTLQRQPYEKEPESRIEDLLIQLNESIISGGGGFTPTETQLAAINSGIDSTKVAQIETNKNNISNLIDAGSKNVLHELVLTTSTSGEISIQDNSDGTFTLNTNGATTVVSGVRIGWFSAKQGLKYAVSNYSASCHLRVRYSGVYILNTADGSNVFTCPSDDRGELVWQIPIGTTLTNYLLKPMVCLESAWKASQEYEPYCPSNYELYKMIQSLQ